MGTRRTTLLSTQTKHIQRWVRTRTFGYPSLSHIRYPELQVRLVTWSLSTSVGIQPLLLRSAVRSMRRSKHRTASSSCATRRAGADAIARQSVATGARRGQRTADTSGAVTKHASPGVRRNALPSSRKNLDPGNGRSTTSTETCQVTN